MEHEYRLIARGGFGHANIPITRMEKEGDVAFAWYHDEFVAMFDLGAVDMLYRTQEKGGTGEKQ